jgi:hypothetical protein
MPGETAIHIPVLELRKLLFEIRDKRPDICIRFRMLGEHWGTHFMRILALTEKGAVLNEEGSKRLFHIPDLFNVIQFEIDRTFQAYQPHFHYLVKPLPEDY